MAWSTTPVHGLGGNYHYLHGLSQEPNLLHCTQEEAHKLAAAEVMYEALIELLSYAPGFYENDPRSDAEIYAGQDAAYKKARAATVTATGGQP